MVWTRITSSLPQLTGALVVTAGLAFWQPHIPAAEPPKATQAPGQRQDTWDLTPPAKEPKYQNEPRYALLVFGQKREQRLWMVLDGRYQ